MKEQIMARFVATSSEPKDTSGVATYTYCGQTIELPMPSFARAREVERFMEHLLRQARRQAIGAAVQQMRGAANTMEADA
jgi:hypothetical protein